MHIGSPDLERANMPPFLRSEASDLAAFCALMLFIGALLVWVPA